MFLFPVIKKGEPMQKEKMNDQKTKDTTPEIEHYSNYKGTPMVRISGNFARGGFNMSRNKIKAVITNIDQLRKFAAGDFDTEILELKEDEVLKP